MTTGLQILQPLTITTATLTASNVPEPATGDTPDPAFYVAGTTYNLNDFVSVASNHNIYQSLQATNLGHDPTLTASATWWILVGSNNRYRMFDQKNSSQTTRAGSVDVTVTPGVIHNGLVLMNISNASTIRVIDTDPNDGVVYDVTTLMQAAPTFALAYNYCFDPIVRLTTLVVNLPTYRLSSIRVIVSGALITDIVGVGVFGIGTYVTVSSGINYGAKVGIQDYSVKTKNAYGDYQITARNYNKRASFDLWVQNSFIDYLQDFMASIRAVPCIYIGVSQFSSTIIYGFYKDFEVNIQYYNVSVFTLTLEGLT
jgi:hypothetical protein